MRCARCGKRNATDASDLRRHIGSRQARARRGRDDDIEAASSTRPARRSPQASSCEGNRAARYGARLRIWRVIEGKADELLDGLVLLPITPSRLDQAGRLDPSLFCLLDAHRHRWGGRAGRVTPPLRRCATPVHRRARYGGSCPARAARRARWNPCRYACRAPHRALGQVPAVTTTGGRATCKCRARAARLTSFAGLRGRTASVHRAECRIATARGVPIRC